MLLIHKKVLIKIALKELLKLIRIVQEKTLTFSVLSVKMDSILKMDFATLLMLFVKLMTIMEESV